MTKEEEDRNFYFLETFKFFIKSFGYFTSVKVGYKDAFKLLFFFISNVFTKTI